MRTSSAPLKTIAARGAGGVTGARGLRVCASDHAGADVSKRTAKSIASVSNSARLPSD